MEALSPDEIKVRANQAEQLRTDPVFQRAVIAARNRHIEQLIVAKPDDIEAIRTIQAQIHAIDSLLGAIGDEILRGKPQRQLAVA